MTATTDTYAGLLDKNQDVLEQSNSWQDAYQQTQNELLDRGTELVTNKLERGKTDAEKSFQKEAIASEADYQEYINPYGVTAEQKAESNLNRGGYNESTNTSAYNVSRIRTAMARQSKEKALVEYDQSIAEAKLSNDSQKAMLALDLLKEKMANISNAFQIESTLTQNQLSATQQTDDRYYGRYQDEYNKIQTERDREEQARRYAEEVAYQKQQDALAQQNWQKSYNLSAEQARANNSNTGMDLTDTSGTTGVASVIGERGQSLLPTLKGYLGEGKEGLVQGILRVNVEKGLMTLAEAEATLKELGYK